MIGTILYAFALLCNNYYFVVQGTLLSGVVDGYLRCFISPRNGVFTGFFFLAIGAKCKDWVWKWSDKKLLRLFLPLYILYIAEFVLVYIVGTPRDDGSLYIMHVLIAPILFLLTCQRQVHVNVIRSKLLRNLSTGIYLLHLPILWFVWLRSDLGIVNFLITLTCSIALCMLSYRIKNKWISSLLR